MRMLVLGAGDRRVAEGGIAAHGRLQVHLARAAARG